MEVFLVAWDEERIEEFKRHILQPNDTFTFSCDMSYDKKDMSVMKRKKRFEGDRV